MGLLMRERRGISWKDQTLESISTPPWPLLAFFGLVILLMSLSSYSSYKAQMERTKISLNVLLFFLPLVLILLAHVTMNNRWQPCMVRIPGLVEYELISREESSPWGVALVAVVVLVMAYYKSSIQSGWFRA
ncbi:hypothetical protein LguiA_003646 [Lonicera macranthoides]